MGVGVGVGIGRGRLLVLVLVLVLVLMWVVRAARHERDALRLCIRVRLHRLRRVQRRRCARAPWRHPICAQALLLLPLLLRHARRARRPKLDPEPAAPRHGHKPEIEPHVPRKCSICILNPP